MSIALNIIKNALIKVAMSFIGEKVLVKATFGILKAIAARTTNTLDDDLVREAEGSYYATKQN